MAEISLNNGRHTVDVKEAVDRILNRNLWDALVNIMDDEIREEAHAELAPCSELEFLNRYLEIAPYDLVMDI